MPFSGGTFSILNTFVPGSTILSAAVNANFSDIATGLSDCLTRDNQAGMTGPLRLTDGAVGAPSLTYNSETGLGLYRSASGKVSLAGGGALAMTWDTTAPGNSGNVVLSGPNAVPLMPVGSIVDYAGSSAPSGWLLCFGQSLLRSGGGSYPELFAAIGTTYGAADGSHFSLPDCRGRGRYGQDNMGGSAANRITNAGSGIVGTTLGAAGGSQSTTLTSAGQLPSHTHGLNSSSGNAVMGNQSADHTHTFTGTTATNTQTGGIGSRYDASSGTVTTSGESGNHTHALSGTTESTGSGTAFGTISPAIIFNTIIFAGR